MLVLSICLRMTYRARFLLVAAFLSGSVLLAAFVAQPDEPPSDSVGVIDGESIAVTGPVSMEVVGGQVKTVLRSGSDVRVRSGTARLGLVEGGQISICGPAHFSVLKSVGSLTVALDTGTIHALLENEPALTIYTAQIQARPIAIGDSPQDFLVGLDSMGGMCLRANRGALRIEQQLTGRSVILPQTGDVLLVDGQIENMRSGTGHCACELQTTKAGAAKQPETSQTAAGTEKSKSAEVDSLPVAIEKPAIKEEPVYQVFMPPLVYDAKAKVQPEVDPRLIVLVRRVRVRPAVFFRGRVEGELLATAAPAPFGPASASPPKAGAPANDSFFDRVRNFVHKLWSRGS